MFGFKKQKFLSFKPKPQSLIGLDIRETSIRLLEIQVIQNKLQVASYASIPLEAEVIQDRQLLNLPAITDSIKKLVQLTQPETRHTAVALPTSSVITRTLELPLGLTEKELENQVYLEAAEHLPYALNEIALDFQPLPLVDKKQTKQPVLLVASRKQLTEQLDKLLLDAGLEPVAIDVESFATERAAKLILDILPNQQADKLVAIANIDGHNSTFSVLHYGKIIYSRDFNFGQQPIETNQPVFSFATSQTPSVETINPSPQSIMQTHLQQIERQQQIFYSNSNYQTIDKLLVAGDSSTIQELTPQLKNYLNISTYLANPFINMLFSNKINVQELNQIAPEMLIACGLALRIKL